MIQLLIEAEYPTHIKHNICTKRLAERVILGRGDGNDLVPYGMRQPQCVHTDGA